MMVVSGSLRQMREYSGQQPGHCSFVLYVSVM